jgi:hypothetical protein
MFSTGIHLKGARSALDGRVKKKPIPEQRLEDLEHDFQPLLLACLRECSQGRWGLFGQNDNTEVARYLYWEDAKRLKDTADEIHGLRAEFGQPNTLVERFLHFCSQHGGNAPGEPKLATAFLNEIQRGDFSSR